MQDIEIIAPADAFRLLLRARYAEKPTLPDQINSYLWFHRAYARAEDCTKQDVDAALDAIRALREGVQKCSIRLRGVLRGRPSPTPPDYIDKAEQIIGELDVFAQTLDCDGQIYEHVFCIKGDVERVGEPAVAAVIPPTVGRPTDRDRVIEEAKRRARNTNETSLAAFAREIRAWLDSLPDAKRVAKTGKVMSIDQIEDHIRPIWNGRRRREI